MATKKAIKEFIEVAEEELYVSEIPEAEVLDARLLTDTVNARVKGTWTQYWGTMQFSFVDGTRYKLPRDLFNYLKNSGNIYDTL